LLLPSRFGSICYFREKNKSNLMQQLSDNTPKALRSTSDIDELTEINGVSIERIEKRAEALEDKTLYENATTILND